MNYHCPSEPSNAGTSMLAANPNKPCPTLFHRLPRLLRTTFSLGGYRVFMCFLLNPAPCSVKPVLCLVGILVIDRFLVYSISSFCAMKFI